MPLVVLFLLTVSHGCRCREIDGLTGSLDARGRNLILVLSDTHRLDHVSGFAKDGSDPTPRLSRLVQDGVSFTEAYTVVPISAPSYATLMTGVSPLEHGLLNNGQPLRKGIPLLQEALGAAGYRTAAVIGNPYCTSDFGFDRGFDVVWDDIETRGKEATVITSEAIRWLEGRRDERPFFLFLAYMDAHVPYITDESLPTLRVEVNGRSLPSIIAENTHVLQRLSFTLQPGRNMITLRFLEEGRVATPPHAPSPLYLKGLRMETGLNLERKAGFSGVEGTGYEHLDNRADLVVVNTGSKAKRDSLEFRCYRKYRREEISAFYDAGIRSFDRGFGRLLSYLQEHGLYRDSIIVFVSDHGEMLGEHGDFGHVGNLWQPTLRVPLIIKVPGLQGGRRDSTRLDLRDLYDHLLNLALGTDTIRLQRIAARRKTPLVAATYPPESGILQATAIDGRFKLIRAAGGRKRLFDLTSDPGETRDLYESRHQEPEIESLSEALHHHLAASVRSRSLDLGELTIEERDRLRALGYLVGEN